MSHFKVYVVTPSDIFHTPPSTGGIEEIVSAALEPWVEWESVDPSEEERYAKYTTVVDQTNEVLAGYKKYLEQYTAKAFAETPPAMTEVQWAAKHYGYQVVTATAEEEKEGVLPSALQLSNTWHSAIIESQDHQLLKVVYRTNENSKWDWFQIGGRYEGKLRSKTMEGRFNSLPAGDIDWAGMVADMAQLAGEEWDRVRSIVGEGNKIPNYEEILQSQGGDEGKAAEYYWAQPGMSGLRTDIDFVFDDERELFNLSREEYCEKFGIRATSAYALVMGGHWHARGSMGWFGESRDEVDRDGWVQWLWNTVTTLPPDSVLTVVDCHI